MAGIKDTTIKSKPGRRYFLGCFGFPWKFSDKKLSQDVVKSSSIRKKNRFLSWSRFGVKKPAVKTVPVDTTSPEKLRPITEIVEISAAPGQTVESKPHKKWYEISNKISLESHENLDSAKNNTCQKAIPRSRKKDSKRNSVIQQVSPERGKKSGLTNRVLSHSASFPAIQVSATATGDSRINKDKSHQESGETDPGKFEPVVGMSIIMVTIIIMVIWGKLCAILCTSAWFYFVPRLRKSMDSNKVRFKNGGMKSDEPELNSEEYKKKVVLEGLLRRSHRNVAGVL